MNWISLLERQISELEISDFTLSLFLKFIYKKTYLNFKKRKREKLIIKGWILVRLPNPKKKKAGMASRNSQNRIQGEKHQMGRRERFYIIKITIPKENMIVVNLYGYSSINIDIYKPKILGNMREIDKPVLVRDLKTSLRN